VNSNDSDVVVIGAGQGGLGISYFLTEASIDHVVLEQSRVGDSWLSHRWDSFALNTPNWMNGLPGAPYAGGDSSGFMTHVDLVDSFEKYVTNFNLPVRTGVEVEAVNAGGENNRRYRVITRSADGERAVYGADSVVVATGIARSPRIPSMASRIPSRVLQLTTGSYRSPQALPRGSVVVVGGGQSGAQIVEDLLKEKRNVYFSISNVPRFPRRYRGRDFMEWFEDMGVWDMKTSEVDDPEIISATNPLVSGVGPLGHTISYQQLARDGARMMGRLVDVRDTKLITDARAHEYIENSDAQSHDIKDKIDQFVAASHLDVPAHILDPADHPVADFETIDTLDVLDLDQADVGTLIWCTGFEADFSWIDARVVDDDGRPLHEKGMSGVPGLYFIGFPWLSKRKSGVVFGIEEDAERICDAIVEERAKGQDW